MPDKKFAKQLCVRKTSRKFWKPKVQSTFASPSESTGILSNADETKAMIEAALFISPRPFDVGELARVCNLGNPGSIRHAVEELQKEYAGRNSAVEIVKENEKYIMRLRGDMEERLTYLAPQQDIPKPHLKTLALIAYNQPVKQSQMVAKRGAVVYEHVKHLVASGFVEAKKEGATKILRTTPMFKEYFKLRNLKDLKNK